MPGVIPDEGEIRMLVTMLGAAPAEEFELRLYVNNKTPALPDAVADYVEMSGHGYAPKMLVASSWSFQAASAGTNTPGVALAPEQVFGFTAAGGGPIDVYGYLIVGLTSGKLWGAERFGDGPYRVANAGDDIRITPTVKLRTLYP